MKVIEKGGREVHEEMDWKKATTRFLVHCEPNSAN